MKHNGIYTYSVSNKSTKIWGNIYIVAACVIALLLLKHMIFSGSSFGENIIVFLVGGFIAVCFGLNGAMKRSAQEGVNGYGIRFNQETLETGWVHGQLEDTAQYSRTGECALRDIDWKVKETYPVNEVKVILSLTKAPHCAKDVYIIGKVALYQGEKSVYELTQLDRSFTLDSYHLGVVLNDRLISFNDTAGDYNANLPVQINHIGEMQLNAVGAKPEWLYVRFCAAPTSKAYAGIVGGAVGVAIAQSIDGVRQTMTNARTSKQSYINTAFTESFIPMLERFKWEVLTA